MNETPIARFEAQVRSQPQRTALSDAVGSYSYSELAERVASVAGWLAGHGLGPGSRVAIFGDRSAASITAILGTHWAGCAYVPMPAQQPAPAQAAILESAEPHAIIAADDSGRRALACQPRGQELPVLLLDGLASSIGTTPLERPRPLESGALAYVMFTSGTTGAPKGVAIEVGSVAHFLAAVQEHCPISAGDRVAQFAPLGFDLSVFEIFSTLGHGGELHVAPERERMAPAHFLRDCAIRTCLLVPSVASLMARLGQLAPGALPSLRLSLFCGEPLPTRLVGLWRDAAPQSEIVNLYGPTEVTVTSLFARCRERLLETPDRSWAAIGSPHAGVAAGVVDAERRFVPRGERGELALHGPQLAAGYWRDEARTRAAFPTLQHPRHGEGRWYLTGDLAFEDEKGAFHFLGRRDNQVKVLGNRIELEGVDAHLRQVSGCETVGSVAWPLVDGTAQGIVAFVAACAREPAEILRLLEERVPAHMVPRRVVQLDVLPVTRNGKLDRRALAGLLEREAAP